MFPEVAGDERGAAADVDMDLPVLGAADRRREREQPCGDEHESL